MNKLLKGLKWALWGLLALLLLLAVLWMASRWWPVPSAEREALQRLEAMPAPGGHDGVALLWTLAFDGPDLAERQALLAQDAEARERSAPGEWSGRSLAAALYPEVQVDAAARCRGGERGAGCLAAVRDDPERFVAAHAGHQGLHARVDQLAQMRDLSSPFRPSEEDPFPPLPAMQALFDPVTAHALAHVQGNSTQALVGLCASISSGRRLLANGDNLLMALMGAGQAEVSARVLADVLVELPADLTLPEPCVAALLPPQDDEFSLCRPMQGELAFNTSVMAQSIEDMPLSALLFDVQRTRQRTAPYYAWACDPAVAVARSNGQPLPLPVPHGMRWTDKDFSCLANPVGCVLGDIAAPVLLQYAQRPDDTAAMLRLVNAQRWLRQHALPPAVAVAQLPPELAGVGTPPSLSADGRYLQLPRTSMGGHSAHKPQWLSVPLVPPPAPTAVH